MNPYDTVNESRYYKVYVIVESRSANGISVHGELIWFTDYQAAELAITSMQEDGRVTAIRLYARKRNK